VRDKIFAMFACIIMAMGMVSSGGGMVSVSSQVIIIASCGLTRNPTSIDWKSLNPSDTSEQDLNFTVITNSGNAATDVSINGSDMTGGGETIAVANVHYYNTTGKTYAQKTALSTTATLDYKALAGGDDYNSYLDISIPVAQPAQTYTGTIQYTSSC
jgi:hypothetical protein